MSSPYIFFLECLTEPPDGALKSMLSLTLIIFVYLYPVVRVFIIHWSRPIFASILAKENRNVFLRHGRRLHAKFRPIPTLYIRSLTTVYDHSEDYFSWNIYGIPFLINNSATIIIFSWCRLFTGPLVSTSVTLETSEGVTTMTKIVGSMTSILTDDANKHHSYVVPHYVFDTKTPVNILVVPALYTTLFRSLLSGPFRKQIGS